jgi:hypothetical protein
MECRGVREKLSGYLEGTATGEEKRLIKEHLDSCASCQEALQDLEKTRDLLRNLEKVEPPPWMTQKIMDRVRQEADRRRGIFHRFFYPLHIKIPVEALAMVFIAVIAVYVYRAVEPELKQAASPLPGPPPATGKRLSRTDEKQFSPKLAEESPAAKKKQKPAEGYPEEKKTAPMADRQELSPSPQTAQEIAREKGTMGLLATGREAQEPQKRPAAARMERPAGKKTGPFAIRLSVRKNEAARKEIGEILRQLAAGEIKDSAGEKNKAVTAEVKGEKLHLFLQKLGEIGEIKEKDLPAMVPEGNIAIRIEIVTTP